MIKYQIKPKHYINEIKKKIMKPKLRLPIAQVPAMGFIKGFNLFGSGMIV